MFGLKKYLTDYIDAQLKERESNINKKYAIKWAKFVKSERDRINRLLNVDGDVLNSMVKKTTNYIVDGVNNKIDVKIKESLESEQDEYISKLNTMRHVLSQYKRKLDMVDECVRKINNQELRINNLSEAYLSKLSKIKGVAQCLD